MKIYFTSSIRGLKNLKNNFDAIYISIKKLGHEYIGNYPFKVTEEDVYAFKESDCLDLLKSTHRYLRECDAIILEISTHSASIGYLIMKALSLKKPVIALYVREHLPVFLLGIDDENFQLVEYEVSTVKETLADAIEYSKANNLTRFNLMLPPNLSNKLEILSHQQNLSKAGVIRKLIEKE